MTLRITTLATLLLLAATAHLCAGERADTTSAIILNPAMDWGGWGADDEHTGDWSRSLVDYDHNNHTARFRVLDPNGKAGWSNGWLAPVPWRTYPILVMRYRAKHLREGSSMPVLSVTPHWSRPKEAVWRSADLRADGLEHEIRRDLREMNLHEEGVIRALYFNLQADQAEGWLELLALRFEADPEAPPIPVAQEELEPITVKVVDYANNPVAGAVVTLDDERVNETRTVLTGADGLATIASAKREGQISIRPKVSKTGMATVRGFHDVRKPREEPYIAILGPASPIGGKVVNEQNEPVVGASVRIYYVSRQDTNDWGNSSKWSWAMPLSSTLTDEHGQWVSEPIITGATWISGIIMHSEYASEGWSGSTSNQVTEPFYSREIVHVLSPGVTVEGTVLDRASQPVSGALVVARDGRGGNPTRSRLTDTAGRFRFDRTRHGEISLTATAEGHGPAMVKMTVDADTLPQELRLDKPHTVRFRVVDTKGQPIPEAYIRASHWRNLNTLKWTARSDQDGKAAWTEAPSDSVSYSIYSEGYQSPSAELRPGDVEHTITLLDPVRISGNVTDAETGEAIKRFDVIIGENIFAGSGISATPTWLRDRATTGANGHYQRELPFVNAGTQLRIEAEGYRPVVSRVLRHDEGNVTLDFKLEKGLPLTGIVRGADGNVTAGATVILITHHHSASITNGREVRRHKNDTVTTTDADGRFEFPMMEKEKIKLVVLHDAGYVEMKLMPHNEPVELKLMPWGRIEGVVHVKGAPAAGQGVGSFGPYAGNFYDLDVYHHLSTTTDEQGRFEFDRVAPGDYPVGRKVTSANGGSTHSHTVPAEVEPGKTTVIAIGGSGRMVLGRLVVPAGHTQPLPWDNERVWIERKRAGPRPKFAEPDNRSSMTGKELETWYNNWYASDEGQAYLRAMRKQIAHEQNFNAVIESDGSFRIEDMPEGTYNLSVRLEAKPIRLDEPQPPLAKIEKRFTIPPIESDHDNEPFNLGDIELAIAGSLNVGDKAPDFELPTLDGKTVKLSNLRGKYVLLDFWATWCGPCVAETPNLKDVFATFGENPRFAMIALSQDNDEKAPRDYAAKHELGWTQAFLPDEHKSRVTAAYGIQGIPSFFLIGPDGRVAATGMRGKAIKETVAEALSK